MIGTVISHYKIIEKIGGGGMGVVYKAEDTKLKRPVALKFLPPAFATDPTTKERFIHEAQAASALQHNNICAIHEIDETEDGQMYIVMDYYEGETLKLKIEKGKLKIDESMDIAIQIAQGLYEAHQKGIVHRDIKSANIIVTDKGEIKILDFGLAKIPKGTVITEEKSTLGTTYYMSPEMIEGRDVDHRTDIWSLGVVLYELFTGELPFKGDYESATMYAILSEPYEPISKSMPDVSEELDGVISKCLEKNPDDRYQHVDDLIVDLRRLKRDSESKITTSRKDILLKASTKNKKPVLMSVILLSAAIIVVTGYLLINQFILEEKPESELIGAVKWENSIAVLPFADLSPKKDQEYFCDGMTEQIITNLSKINKLKVIGRTSVMKFKNTEKTLPEIGKELDVSHILEGSIRKYGNNIRITAQLVNTEDGSHLWVEDYDRELENIFKIQDDISEKIYRELLQKLSIEDIEVVKSSKPKNIEAWEYYLKGKYFHISKYFGATWSMDDFNTSELMLKKAIELDPNYAPSYAALADLYNSYYNIEAQNEDEKKKYLDLQKKYIETAYNLNQNSAEVYRIMGYVQQAKGEPENAFESFKKAILIQPNSWESHYGLSDFYSSKDLLYLAVKFSTKAIELNPLHPSCYVKRSWRFSALGELEKAEMDLQKVLEINPDHNSALFEYGLLLIILKKYNKVDKIISRLKQIYPKSNSNQVLRAFLLAANGEKDKALEINLRPFDKFRLYLFLKMKEEVIQYLNKDFERVKNSQEAWYLWFINYPPYEFLHSDPRFQEILAKHKELYEENLAKYGDIDI